MERRRRVTAAEAASRAAELIPDPGVFVPPPVEEREESESAEDVPPGLSFEPSHGPWGTIIDSIISVDPERTFLRLRAELSLDSEHVNYASVAAALDLADRRYFEASTLVRAAKLEEQRVDREIEMRLEVLRTQARADVEKDKRAAILAAGSKAVGNATIEEVKDRCRSNWPDEMSSLERRRDEHHAARGVAEELATAWRSRAASLRELVVGLRGR